MINALERQITVAPGFMIAPLTMTEVQPPIMRVVPAIKGV
jgi:hypothetical protein